MKKVLFIFFTAFTFHTFAQNPDNAQMQELAKEYKIHYGIKAGYNFAKVTGSTPNFNPKSNNGFMAGGFIAPATKGGFGFRSEIIFSRQGFSFDASGKITHVKQDYIYLPQLTTFTIAKKLQLQAGAQVGYLLNAKKNSSGSPSANVLDYFNRIDYGAAAGFEVYPLKHVIVGARYNISRGNIYKQTEASSTGVPSPFPFDPNQLKAKNGVIQLFFGVKL